MDESKDLSVVFEAASSIEASVVQALLESHGIDTLVEPRTVGTVLPLKVDGIGHVRLSVRSDQVVKAHRVITGYENELESEMGRQADEFLQLESSLDYNFQDKGLLEDALTHRSRAHEDVTGGVSDNESLEFLGDAVLGFVISDRLFREFPDWDEGQKSKAKALLVSGSTLTTLGQRLDLGSYLYLGRGEEKSGGRRKPSLVADAFEAVVAAIYVDGGIAAADNFIERQFRESLEEIRVGRVAKAELIDHKSALQIWLHEKKQPRPTYVLTGEHGPDHAKLFNVTVEIGGEGVSSGEGRSKKEAEQQAAERALVALGERLNQSQ
jgi:ribonuclease-3